MNQRATETNLNNEEFEQLKEAYVSTIVDSMSMKDFLYNCSESEVVNELLIKVKYTLDEQFYNKFVKQIKGE